MTEHDGHDQHATDVLVIGSGSGGAAVATSGIDPRVITEDRRTADTPRAHMPDERVTERRRAPVAVQAR